MFCVHCGTALGGNADAVCLSCGKTNPPALSAADVSRVVKTASNDALDATKRIATDPIAGLVSSFSALGTARARAAGIAFGVAFALLTAISGTIALSRLSASPGFNSAFGLFIVALVPFATIAALGAASRKLFNTGGDISADVFTAGVSLLPLAIFFFLASLLGIANYQLIALLAFFAWTYMLCILFTGCTRLEGLPERFAPPTIAVMLLAAMWLTKVFASSFFDAGNPLGRLFH